MAQQTAKVFRRAIGEASLEPMPLEPSQIISGNPEASGVIYWKSEDGKDCNGIWQCTPGVFNYTHTDETATLIAGRVTVTTADGETVELGPGDIAFFPEGSTTHWDVHETVRKSFHLHAADGLPF